MTPREVKARLEREHASLVSERKYAEYAVEEDEQKPDVIKYLQNLEQLKKIKGK